MSNALCVNRISLVFNPIQDVHAVYDIYGSTCSRYSWDLCNPIQVPDWNFIIVRIFKYAHTLLGLGLKKTQLGADQVWFLWQQVKRKQTASGVALGEDVLTLVVEPNVDHLLIMGLVVVCGLINHHIWDNTTCRDQ